MLAALAVPIVVALALSSGRHMPRRGPTVCRAAPVASTLPGIRAVDICTPDVQELAAFYEACFGMERTESAGVVEMGYAGDTVRLRLVETPSDAYRLGEGFDCIALSLPDVSAAVSLAEARGGRVTTPLAPYVVGPSKVPDEPVGTTHETLEAQLSDPQGYSFRLIQREGASPSVAKVVLRVTDLERSSAFYSGLIGMSVLRWRSNLMSVPPSMSLLMQLGDPSVLSGAPVLEQSAGSSPPSAVLELIYPYNTRKMDVGEGGAGRLTIAAAGAHDIATRAPSGNGKVVRTAPGDADAEVEDPDGFRVRLVDLL